MKKTYIMMMVLFFIGFLVKDSKDTMVVGALLVFTSAFIIGALIALDRTEPLIISNAVSIIGMIVQVLSFKAFAWIPGFDLVGDDGQVKILYVILVIIGVFTVMPILRLFVYRQNKFLKTFASR